MERVDPVTYRLLQPMEVEQLRALLRSERPMLLRSRGDRVYDAIIDGAFRARNVMVFVAAKETQVRRLDLT